MLFFYWGKFKAGLETFNFKKAGDAFVVVNADDGFPEELSDAQFGDLKIGMAFTGYVS